MKEQPRQEAHYSEGVWVNPTIEPIRGEECMCLHCGHFNPGAKDHCETAQAFFRIRVQANVAFVVSRCREWKPIK